MNKFVAMCALGIVLAGCSAPETPPVEETAPAAETSTTTEAPAAETVAPAEATGEPVSEVVAQ